MIAWALTYLLHSTVLILAGWAFARSRWGRPPGVGDAIWKCALAGALLTATLQQVAGAAVSLVLPIPARTSFATIDSDGPLPAAGLSWVVLAWAATACVAAGRLAHGWFRLRRAAGRRRVISGGPLRRELDAILTSAGVTRRITLSCSRRLAVPRTIGSREICVPVRVLRDLTRAEQRALLAHEIAHLVRRDGAWLLAAALLQALTWWQPLTRVAIGRLRRSMEFCCDDWAASRIPDPMALADCLVKVGEWGVTRDAFPLAAFAARGSMLRERVERIVDPDPIESVSWGRLWLAAVPLAIVLGLAPRVTLAEAEILRSPVLPRVVIPVRQPDRAAPAAERSRSAGRQVRTVSPIARRLPERPAGPQRPDDDVVQAPVVEERAPSPVASGHSTIVSMSEPLVRQPAGLRLARRAARLLPEPAAMPPMILSQASLERRVDAWVAYHRRSLSFDPLKPDYDLPRRP